MKIQIRNLCCLLLINALCAAYAMAAPQIMSAPEAQTALKAGEMFLLDIRAEEEWKEDGIAEGAFPVSMHKDDFGIQLNKILGQIGDRKLGLICATGGRTQYVASILERNGIKNLVDVSESMHGNAKGPGWIKRKLPVVSLEEAQKHYAEMVK